MHRLVLAVVVAALGSAANVSAQSAARLDTGEVRRWREDLAVLREAMPAHHANLYHSMSPAQFDSGLVAIDRRLPRLARYQVIVELQKLLALVGDGHSSVGPWRDTSTAYHQLPAALYRFGDGLFVRAATTSQAALIGRRVVAIGGVPIDEAIERVRPLISHDNEMGVRAWAPVMLTMPEVLQAVGLARDLEHVSLTLEAGGRRSEVVLEPAGSFPMLTGDIDRTWWKRDGWVDARDRSATPTWLSDPTNRYWFRWLAPERTLYCQLNTIQQKPEDSLATFFARAMRVADSARAERFVLDLRLNGGGNGDWNRDIVRALIKSRYDVPGRLVVITGRRTFSAAQMLISELEKYTEATFVGEPSASRGNAYGDSYRIVMPNSRVTVRVSSLYWQYWDPRDLRPWIEVAVPAPMSFADYAAGRDPALEAAQRTNVHR